MGLGAKNDIWQKKNSIWWKLSCCSQEKGLKEIFVKYPNIKAEHLIIGKNVVIEDSAIIRGLNGNAESIVIGDNTYIGESVQIICDNFSIGDYSKIHHHTNIHGYKPCKIGHNAWIGQYSIIDSIGGTSIGNNCGFGAQTQLWSHIKFGDTLEGCHFCSDKPLNIGNDIYFGGNSIVLPIKAEDKSMALSGAVITKDMKYNEVYAGSPAVSISAKIGFQFGEVTIEEKLAKMNNYIRESGIDCNRIKVVSDISEINFDDDTSYFAVKSRQYKKTLSDDEIKFMKFLLPEKGKFIPI
jgi:acetyltransferase-like isoleucine patch superfamily enzyme